jgi:hypothetical protein
MCRILYCRTSSKQGWHLQYMGVMVVMKHRATGITWTLRARCHYAQRKAKDQNRRHNSIYKTINVKLVKYMSLDYTVLY